MKREGQVGGGPEARYRTEHDSMGDVTALNSCLGYQAAARIAHEALETGQTIRSVVISQGYVARGEITRAQLDAALDVLSMTGCAQSDDT